MGSSENWSQGLSLSCGWSAALDAVTSFLLILPPAGLSHHKHKALKMDEAILTVNNELNAEVVVSWVSERCFRVKKYTHKHTHTWTHTADILLQLIHDLLQTRMVIWSGPIVFPCSSVCTSSWGCYPQRSILASPVLQTTSWAHSMKLHYSSLAPLSTRSSARELK